MITLLSVRSSRLMLCLLGLSLAVASCDKDEEEEDNEYTLSGNGNGAAERPTPVTTPGTGSVTGTYNADNNLLTYTVNWANLTSVVILGHFHGPAGPEEVAGPVVNFTINNTATTASTSGSATLTEEQESQLLSGKWYFNIHSNNFKGGEIRGQVMTTR